ncbi:MAG: hypothetical protein AD742_02980 [Methylibium sp. NZG]|nr:MAG: hypothetical protein AD742_02980 [Methylibium sp. NZG]
MSNTLMKPTNCTNASRADRRATGLLTLTTLIALTSLLVACGGGSGGTAAAPPPAQQSVEYVPAAASDGVSVFAGWLKQMSAESMDGKDAMNTRTFTPTVQDDAEPVAAPL